MEDSKGGSDNTMIYIIGGVFFLCALIDRVELWFKGWIRTLEGQALFSIILGATVGSLYFLGSRKRTAVLEKRKREERVLGEEKGATYCGKSDAGEPVYIKPRQRGMHTQVVGTTNAGKTESVILPWAIQDIQAGRGLILIDGKADRSLLDKLYAYTKAAKREKDFLLFSLGNTSESQSFNPLIGGTAEEKTERIFNAFDFDNPFYKSVQYEVLAQVLRLFEAAKEEPTFLKLHQAISSPALLSKLSDTAKNPLLERWVSYFSSLAGAERDQRTAGLTSQISHFAYGATSSLFNQKEPTISVEESLTKNKIVYFQLPALLSPFLGKATGKLVLQALQAAVANRHRSNEKDPKFFSVFLDDFSEYLYPGFVTVLNKSRSANVGIVFAHQALGDIEAMGDSIANAILTNSNIKIFMRGNDPASAEYFSKVVGTKGTTKKTERRKTSYLIERSTGDISAREVEEFIIHPNHFKRDIGVGQAVMIVPHENGAKTVKLKFDRFPDMEPQTIPTMSHPLPEMFELPKEPKKKKTEEALGPEVQSQEAT